MELSSVKLDTGMKDPDNRFQHQIYESSPQVSILNTPYNPNDLKIRWRSSVEHGLFTGTIYANYVNSYTDNRLGASARIASWTTFDASLGCRLPSAFNLKNTSLTFSGTNLTNRNPPYVSNPTFE